MFPASTEKSPNVCNKKLSLWNSSADLLNLWAAFYKVGFMFLKGLILKWLMFDWLSKFQSPLCTFLLKEGRGLWLKFSLSLAKWQHRGNPEVFLEMVLTQTRTSFVQRVQLFWHHSNKTTLWFNGKSPELDTLKISACTLYCHRLQSLHWGSSFHSFPHYWTVYPPWFYIQVLLASFCQDQQVPSTCIFWQPQIWCAQAEEATLGLDALL